MSAVCALTLACALGASARATQDSTGDATAKPATTKKTTTASTHSSASSKSHTTSSKKHSRKKTAHVRGQQKIDPERAQAIQEALIREHYLTGSPTGEWNAASEAAMRRFQEDNGWQSVVVPDSRALIKLGLGPSNDHLLNPESAMTTVPNRPKADPTPTTSHSTPPTSDPPAPTAQPATSSQSSPDRPQ